MLARGHVGSPFVIFSRAGRHCPSCFAVRGVSGGRAAFSSGSSSAPRKPVFTQTPSRCAGGLATAGQREPAQLQAGSPREHADEARCAQRVARAVGGAVVLPSPSPTARRHSAPNSAAPTTLLAHLMNVKPVLISGRGWEGREGGREGGGGRVLPDPTPKTCGYKYLRRGSLAEPGFDPGPFGLWAQHASHCAIPLKLFFG